jgi:hypothetical protein
LGAAVAAVVTCPDCHRDLVFLPPVMISRSPGTNKKGAICIAPFGFPLFSLISTEHFQYPAFWYTSIRTELIDDDKIGPLFIEELLYAAVQAFRTS